MTTYASCRSCNCPIFYEEAFGGWCHFTNDGRTLPSDHKPAPQVRPTATDRQMLAVLVGERSTHDIAAALSLNHTTALNRLVSMERRGLARRREVPGLTRNVWASLDHSGAER